MLPVTRCRPPTPPCESSFKPKPRTLRSPPAKNRCEAGSSEKRATRLTPSSPRKCRCQSSRSEEHTSELQSRENLVCRLLLEKKNEEQPAGRQSHGVRTNQEQ